MTAPKKFSSTPSIQPTVKPTYPASETDGLAEHVRDADLLVIEATFLERGAVLAEATKIFDFDRIAI